MTTGRSGIQRIKFAVNDPVKRHRTSAGANHRGQDQSEFLQTWPSAIVSRRHGHRRQSERQRENGVRKLYERTPFSDYRKHLLFRLGFPSARQRVLHSDVIQNSCHNSVDDLFDSLRPRIEERIGGENRRTGQREQFEILDVNEIQRRFAWHQDQFLFFFQNHICGSQQHVFAKAVCNPTKRAHTARYDNHRIRRVGTTRKRSVHALEVVHFRAEGEFQSIGQFLGNDGLCVVAQDDVNVVLCRMKIIEQTLSVKDPTGTCDGNDDSQGYGCSRVRTCQTMKAGQ